MYNLDRFVEAQRRDYVLALNEIKKGRKVSHWIWYIFPQLTALGKSHIAKKYGICDLDEAKAYFEHDVLRANLLEISKMLLRHSSKSIVDIMNGSVDAMKVQSSMTLFYLVSHHKVFKMVLDTFFDGEMDIETLNILKRS